MTFSKTRILVLAAAVAATPLLALPAAAQSDGSPNGGVSITIRKAPSYLNTRTIARPATSATYDTKAGYQPVYQARNNLAFSRSPLPSTFDVPGY